MTLRRKIILSIVLVVLGGTTYLGYVGYKLFLMSQRVPEAYAAWDTGTLLVLYLKENHDHWPKSWDDLLSVTRSEAGNQIQFWGLNGDRTNYLLTLRNKVAIDWKFDPSKKENALPVTRTNGTKFMWAWQGAEPNEMVRAYLKTSTNGALGKLP